MVDRNPMSFATAARVSRCFILSAAFCSIAPRALAHGGPPSVVGVVAAGPSGLRVVLVNEGIALKRDTRWTFLCPSLWGNTSASVAKVPLALSADGQTSWVAGEQDLYLLHDGVFEPQGRSDLNASHVELLAGDTRGVFALVLTDSGTEIVHFGAPQPEVIWHSIDYWSSLVLNGDLLQVARITDDMKSLVLVSLKLTGEVTEMKTVARDFEGDTSVDLRPTPRGLFAVMSTGAQHVLVAVDKDALRVVARSATPIHGPQASPDGSLWIGADDKLQHAVGDAYEATTETRLVTCMGRWNSLSYACVTGELYGIENTGLGAQLFRLQGFEGPEPQLVTEPAKQYCDFQWVLFKNDLMLGNYEPVDAVAAIAPGGEAGASVGAGSGSTAGAAGVTALPVAGGGVTQAAGTDAITPAANGCSVDMTVPGKPPSGFCLIAFGALAVVRRRRAVRRQG
jgi:MYXO-CTERM domain-containing protein